MKMAVFWFVVPCSLVKFIDVSEMLRASVTRAMMELPVSIIALVIEVASTSETSVNFYQTTRHSNPEDSGLNARYFFANS
jgi:hypothetical protein